MSTSFYETLFPGTDEVCMGKSVFDTKITGASIDTSYQYFCINAVKEKRRDDNVICYRNILLEFDNDPIPKQMERILTSRIPFTSIVFSGGKSLHVIISLANPLADEFEYRSLVERIYNKMPGVDKACSNPSRFSRAPNGNRNGVVQDLIELHKNVPNNVLEEWLGPKPVVQEAYAHFAPSGHLSGWTMNFLAFGAPLGEWNKKLFTAVCDMSRQGWEYERIISKCESVTGWLDSRDKSTIKSAFKTAQNEIKSVFKNAQKEVNK